MKTHLVAISALERGAAATVEQKSLIRQAVRATLAFENADKPCAVIVSTTDDAGIRALNREHRDVDSATDVLSFPMFDLAVGELPEPGPWQTNCGRTPLGDIVISLERVAAQAAQYGHTPERELAFLTVHAALHLLGYDHERGEEDERLHFSKQEEILERIGVMR